MAPLVFKTRVPVPLRGGGWVRPPHASAIPADLPGRREAWWNARMPKRPSPPAPGEPKTEEPRLGDVLEFLRLLWAVDHRLQSVSKRMGRSLGVTGPQRLVLRFTGLFPGVTSSRLSDLLHLHPSTLTGVVQRLQNAGFLTRVPDPADGRRALLRLTPSGRRLTRRSGPTVETAMSRVLARHSSVELQAARSVLASVAQELRALSEPLPAGRRRGR